MNLYRAVSQIELDDILTTGIFRDGPNLSGKGFFFDRDAAESFALWGSSLEPSVYYIVQTEALTEVIRRGKPHDVMGEGTGVYLRDEDLPHLIPIVLEGRH